MGVGQMLTGHIFTAKVLNPNKCSLPYLSVHAGLFVACRVRDSLPDSITLRVKVRFHSVLRHRAKISVHIYRVLITELFIGCRYIHHVKCVFDSVY